jgi:hypothetical protein
MSRRWNKSAQKYARRERENLDRLVRISRDEGCGGQIKRSAGIGPTRF